MRCSTNDKICEISILEHGVVQLTGTVQAIVGDLQIRTHETFRIAMYSTGVPVLRTFCSVRHFSAFFLKEMTVQ